MNLIFCDQNCLHQEEGYCALNQITQLTGDPYARCGYFQALVDNPPLGEMLPKEFQGL